MLDDENKFEDEGQGTNGEYDFSNYVHSDQDEQQTSASSDSSDAQQQSETQNSAGTEESQPNYYQRAQEEHEEYNRENTNQWSESQPQSGGNNRVIQPKNNKKGNGFWVALSVAACTIIVIGGCVWAAYNYMSAVQTVQQGNSNTGIVAEESTAENTDTADSTDSTEESKAASTLTKADTETGSISTTSNVTATMVDVSDIVDEVIPSLVSITNTTLYNVNTVYGEQQKEGVSSGSGVIIGENDDELLIVTNAHVVNEDSTTSYYYTTSLEIQVTFYGDVTVDAYVKGTDEDADLAVIGVKLSDIDDATKSQIKIATIGDSTQCKMGDFVVAIGNALGYGQSATYGIISAVDREVTSSDGTSKTMIQTDAAINPGNSGGGMFDMNGHLIGINSAKYSDTDVEGMGFAIPISSAESIITELMNATPRVAYSEEEQGYLGFYGSDVSSSLVSMGYPAGAVVSKTITGLAAETSGIQRNDIITAINGTEVSGMNQLKSELQYYKAGETVTLTVMRVENNSFKEIELSAVLSSYDEKNNASESESDPAQDQIQR